LIPIIGISVGTTTNISLFLLTENLPGIFHLILVATIVVIGGVLTMIGLILIVLGRRESCGTVRQKSDKPIIDTKKELANNYLILDFTPNFSIGNSKEIPMKIPKNPKFT